MAQRRSTTKKGSSAKRGARSKSGAKRSATPAHELPGGFWRQILAVMMILVACVLVFTWLGDGGDFLNIVDQKMMEWIGYAKFLLPVLLIWLAAKVLRSENNRIPVVVWIAGFLMIFWVAGMTGIPSIGKTGELSGGVVGEWMNGIVTQILAPGVAVVIYIVLILITGMFIMQMTPAMAMEALRGLCTTKEEKIEKEEKKAVKAKVEKKLPKKAKNDAEESDEKELKINLGMAAEAAQVAKEEEKKTKRGLGLFGRGKKTKVEVSKAETADDSDKEEVKAPVKAVATEPQALVSVDDKDWKLPSMEYLSKKQTPTDPGNCTQNAHIIKTTLADFGINVEMEGANVGPRITQYTMRPPAGVNLTKITSRDKELALNLAVEQIRIEAPIPGTRLVGVEVPNVKPASVGLRSILESKEWTNAKGSLPFVVGKDISGKGVVADLAKMPHLLIAGTTGSGKSVMTNMLIMSLLYRNSPSDLKLIMIDPKQVEMTQYEDIPHLLTPVITAVEKSLSAMRWAVNEMERRYTLMAKEKVKKIDDYNAKMAAGGTVTVKDEDGNEQQHNGGKMPFIVIIVDEMADLMMQAGKDLEALIVRIAQKGRAAGIHLVLATQSPKVQVITGLIKSNVPSRITFKVTNFTESSVALGMSGAEKLLGMGDMIMLTTEMGGKPRRIQSAFAEDKEILAVTDFLREQRAPEYNDEVVAQPVQIGGGKIAGPAGLARKFDPNDPTVQKAIDIMLKNGKFSTAMLQTWLGKGHGFVSGLAIWLEEIGVIGPANGHKPREVLISSMEEFMQMASGEGAE